MKKIDLNYDKVVGLINSGISISDIAQEFKCSKDPVYSLLKNNNFKTSAQIRQEEIQQIKNTDIESWLKGALIGTILGDGWLVKKVTGTQFCVCHSFKQTEYLRFKFQLFKPIITMDSPYINEKRQRTEIWSTIHPQLDELYYEVYGTGKRRVTKKLLQDLTLLGFALWYMDDGSYGGDYNLYTYALPLEDQQLIRQMLRRKFDIWTSIVRHKTVTPYQYYLRVCARSFYQFEKLVGPFINMFQCMKHKYGAKRIKFPQRLNAEHLL